MKVYVVQDASGKVLCVNRTPDGVAHFAASHGLGATIGGAPLQIESVDKALSTDGTAMITFSDGTEDLRVEHHAILV